MCGSDLVPYSHSKGSFVVETEVGGVDNIPVTVKKKYADNFLQEDSLLTCKLVIRFIFNTLSKIIIERDVYEKYISNFIITLILFL